MNQQENNSFVESTVRTGQLIVMALAIGVLMFGGLTVVLRGGKLAPFDPATVMSAVMLVFSISVGVARLFVPSLIVRGQCRKIADQTERTSPGTQADSPDQKELAQVFLTKTIVASALLEGGAFANLVAFMLEGQVYSIIVAVILVLWILAGFPTRHAFDNFLESCRRTIQETRDMPDY